MKKVKIFSPNKYFDDLTKEINKFIQDKKIIDIKFNSIPVSETKDFNITIISIYHSVMVEYEEEL